MGDFPESKMSLGLKWSMNIMDAPTRDALTQALAPFSDVHGLQGAATGSPKERRVFNAMQDIAAARIWNILPQSMQAAIQEFRQGKRSYLLFSGLPQHGVDIPTPIAIHEKIPGMIGTPLIAGFHRLASGLRITSDNGIAHLIRFPDAAGFANHETWHCHFPPGTRTHPVSAFYFVKDDVCAITNIIDAQRYYNAAPKRIRKLLRTPYEYLQGHPLNPGPFSLIQKLGQTWGFSEHLVCEPTPGAKILDSDLDLHDMASRLKYIERRLQEKALPALEAVQYLISQHPDYKVRMRPYAITYEPGMMAIFREMATVRHSRPYPISNPRWALTATSDGNRMTRIPKITTISPAFLKRLHALPMIAICVVATGLIANWFSQLRKPAF